MRYLFYQPEVFNTDSQEPNDTKQKSKNILLPHVSTIFHHCPQFNHILGPSQGFRSEVHFLHVETQAWTFLFSLPKLQYKGTTTKDDDEKVYFLVTSLHIHGCYFDMLLWLCWVFVEKFSKSQCGLRWNSFGIISLRRNDEFLGACRKNHISSGFINELPGNALTPSSKWHSPWDE